MALQERIDDIQAKAIAGDLHRPTRHGYKLRPSNSSPTTGPTATVGPIGYEKRQEIAATGPTVMVMLDALVLVGIMEGPACVVVTLSFSEQSSSGMPIRA
ncbi:hypothetical protein BBP40_009398 [Aspergillus hancockii]|nr:hypothetical protein BBP40_009398 [Aspergillus hancockii]